MENPKGRAILSQFLGLLAVLRVAVAEVRREAERNRASAYNRACRCHNYSEWDLVYAKITFEEEQFTAFYILGEGGNAENYTKEVHLLEPSSMIVGVENYEHAPANYTLQVNLGGYPIHKQQIKLAHGEKWEDSVSFTPKHVAKHAKLEFLLYKDGSTDPYRSVHLGVDSLIDYDNLAAIREYALPDPPTIKG